MLVRPGGLARAISLVFALLLLGACATQEVDTARVAVPTPDDGRPPVIALLGATGLVGSYLLDDALDRGFELRVLARSPAKLADYGERITVIQGDARDAATIARLVQGSDLVISALGPVRADGDAALMISTTTSGHIVDAMEANGIGQYIVVSGGGVVVPGDDRNFTGWLMRQMVRVGLADTLRDKQAEYELLAKSPADYVVVRCPIILDEPYREPAAVSLVTPGAFTLRAGELSDFILGQVGSSRFDRTAPFVYSR